MRDLRILLPLALLALLLLPVTDAAAQRADSLARMDARADSLARAATPEGREAALGLWRRVMAGHRQRGDRLAAARVQVKAAQAHRNLGRADSSLANDRAVMEVAHGTDPVLEAGALHGMAVVWQARARPDSSRSLEERALALLRGRDRPAEEAHVLHGLGNAFLAVGQLDSALARYREALPLRRRAGDRPSEAATLNNVGLVLKNLGRPDSSLAYHRQALALRRELGDRAGEASSYTNVGLVFNDLGRPDSALAYHSRALALLQGGADRRAEAATLTNIGIAQSLLGRPDSAIAYFRRDLALSERAGDRAGWVRALTNVALIQERFLGQPDSALAAHRIVLRLRRDMNDRSGIGTTLTGIGHVHRKAGRPDSALVHFREALEIHTELGDRMRQAIANHDIAESFLVMGRPDSAVGPVRRTLALRRETRDRLGEGTALGTLALALQLRAAPGDRAAALAHYDSAAAALADVAGSAGGDAARVSFRDAHADLTGRWALAWLAEGTEEGRAAALAVADRGQAQGLLGLVRGRPGAPAPATVPGADLVAEGRSLLEGLRRSGRGALSYLVTDDTLVVLLALPSGRVEEERVALGRDSLASRVGALRVALGAGEEETAPALARGGAEPEEGGEAVLDAAVVRSAADELARAVLPARLARRLPERGELVIVAPGSLGALPFALLPAGREPLGVRLALRGAPSLSVLRELEGRGAAGEGASLVLGNPVMPSVPAGRGGGAVPAALPFAEREARAVAGLLGVEPLLGAAATEAAVRARIGGARVVHLATHAYVYGSEARVGQSFVALAPGGGEDGVLSLGELLAGPPLRAELVVLSGCRTGLGDLRYAEGTVGLPRAFLARGARGVLASLWSVPDRAAARVMESFYRHWLRDPGRPGAAEALRRARAELRGEAGMDDPRLWAAFQLVGA